MIIFLNGTSSSGKSTIARELMRQSEQPFLYYSIDHLVNFWIDEKFVAFEDEPKEWFFHQHFLDDEGHSLTQIVDGPNAQQLHWDMIDALMVLIKKGYDLIIDEVLWNTQIFQHYAPALSLTNHVYLVKVICDLIETERRESLREDRFAGLARALYPQVYANAPAFDFEVDTTYTSSYECAKSILQYVHKNKKPEAFLKYIRSEITFKPLQRENYGLLQNWLNAEHLASTWGEGKMWRFSDVEEKYKTYLEKYKIVNGNRKPILGFIIYCANHPIGYIQYYNAYDFPREGYELHELPSNLAALDVYIGDPHYTNKGLGPVILEQFCQEHVWSHFNACFVDPAEQNVHAIKAYGKAGFTPVKHLKKPGVVWMIKRK
jgi:aminoglycoside 6'-N-acetyltransferase